MALVAVPSRFAMTGAPGSGAASVESLHCRSDRHGWVRDRFGGDSACLVIATDGVWMERDPDAAPVTIDALTVSYRSMRSELWVQHTANHHDNLEIIRLRRNADLPGVLAAARHATARLSMDCILAHADLLAARARAVPPQAIDMRLARLVEFMIRDLTVSLQRPVDVLPSHHHLAERVRFSGGAAASRSHTSRVFKSATGMTLSHYRQRSRLVAAIRRIASDDGTFASIATETGFADHAHLTRSLAQVTGTTPKALRARFRAD